MDAMQTQVEVDVLEMDSECLTGGSDRLVELSELELCFIGGGTAQPCF